MAATVSLKGILEFGGLHIPHSGKLNPASKPDTSPNHFHIAP